MNFELKLGSIFHPRGRDMNYPWCKYRACFNWTASKWGRKLQKGYKIVLISSQRAGIFHFPTEQIRCEHTIVRQNWASSDNILSFPTRPDKMWPSCRFENHCAYWHTPATLPDNRTLVQDVNSKWSFFQECKGLFHMGKYMHGLEQTRDGVSG